MASRAEDAPGNHRAVQCLIRPAILGDADLARSLGRGALAAYGDYEEVLPEWLARADVETLVATVSGVGVGLAMLHYSRLRFRRWVADLVAIAVDPRWARSGIGKQLLQCAEDKARRAAPVAPVIAMRLDVAEDNLPARRLFERAGFFVVRSSDSYYPGGQRALEMWKPLWSPSFGRTSRGGS